MRSEVKGVKSELQEVKANTHRTLFIVEELSRDVKIHMKAFAHIHQKQMLQDEHNEDFNQRLEKLELVVKT